MKVFIAGSREIKQLDEKICIKLNSICEKKFQIIIGDAFGIDSCVQNYLNQKKYKDVKVYASNGFARNNLGNWKVENVKVENNIKGFEFYAQKDLEMAKQSDIGFMIWNGRSRGTFNNIVNLLNLNKEVILYYITNNKYYDIKNFGNLETFLKGNVKMSSKLKKILPSIDNNKFVQMVLF